MATTLLRGFSFSPNSGMTMREKPMADVVSKETRSKMMGSIRSVSSLENRVASQLWKKGLRFRRNSKKLFGCPDISIEKYKVVVFIDSCFWHNCPLHIKIPQTNIAFWVQKLEKNKVRDNMVSEHYRTTGWNVKRVWEHDLKQNFGQTVDDIFRFILVCKNNKGVETFEGRTCPQNNGPS